MIQDTRFNSASSKFLERAEERKINGVTSTSIVLESTHRIMILEATAILPEIKAKNLVKYLKIHPEIVKKLPNHQSIPLKIASFNLEIISPDIDTIARSQRMKNQYGFLSNDALTLQIMKDRRIDNLASNDSDFEKVPFVTVYKPSPIITE